MMTKRHKTTATSDKMMTKIHKETTKILKMTTKRHKMTTKRPKTTTKILKIVKSSSMIVGFIFFYNCEPLLSLSKDINNTC